MTRKEYYVLLRQSFQSAINSNLCLSMQLSNKSSDRHPHSLAPWTMSPSQSSIPPSKWQTHPSTNSGSVPHQIRRKSTMTFTDSKAQWFIHLKATPRASDTKRCLPRGPETNDSSSVILLWLAIIMINVNGPSRLAKRRGAGSVGWLWCAGVCSFRVWRTIVELGGENPCGSTCLLIITR